MKSMKVILICLCILLSGCAEEVSNKNIHTFTPSPEVTVTATPISTFTPITEVSPEITQEPVSPTPEVSDSSPIAETPDIQTTKPALEQQEQCTLSEEELISLLTMKKPEIIQTLGDKYEIPISYEGEDELYYREYGIIITFDTFYEPDTVISILILNDEITINGVRKNMSFKEIRSILGEGRRIEDDKQGTYSVYYDFENYSLYFYALGTDEESQKDKAFCLRRLINVFE